MAVLNRFGSDSRHKVCYVVIHTLQPIRIATQQIINILGYYLSKRKYIIFTNAINLSGIHNNSRKQFLI